MCNGFNLIELDNVAEFRATATAVGGYGSSHEKGVN
jgi:hypothetical protein